MKKIVIILMAISAFAGCASHSTDSTSSTRTYSSSNALEKKVTVQRYVMNPDGEVDGLILTDGSQLVVPPRYSKELIAIAAPKQVILVNGFMEDERFIPQRITNVRTGQSVSDLQTLAPERSSELSPLAATPIEHGIRDRTYPRKQKILSAQGIIQSQLYSPNGEVNGLILSEGSVVRFPPHMIDESIKIKVGDNIQASGYGTKNSRGQSIEATQIRN